MQAMGGAVAAVETGYMKQQLVASHAERRARIEAGTDTVVGLNKFTTTEPNPLLADLDAAIQTVDPAVEARAVAESCRSGARVVMRLQPRPRWRLSRAWRRPPRT